MTHKKLVEAVERWGENKGITGPNGTGTIQRQMDKLEEEFQELKDAIKDKNLTNIEDAIGDMQVVMILLSQLLTIEYQKSVTVIDSLRQAYNVIEKRKGKMINGQFVKNK